MNKSTILSIIAGVVIISVLFIQSKNTQAAEGWLARTGSGERAWSDIASSADGIKLVASVLTTGSPAEIYTSTDGGITWVDRDMPTSNSWVSVASSDDGTKLATASTGFRSTGGYIYTSTDSGATWTQQTGSGQRIWSGIASSGDGVKLVAVDKGDRSSQGYIYTSTDGGVTWTEQTNSGTHFWTDVASSDDGTKLVAVANQEDEYIYTSTDSGVNWTEQTSAGDNVWESVASSSDGTKLVAGGTGLDNDDYVYTSTDSGVTWTQRTTVGQGCWHGVASSDDGTKLFAVDACRNNGGYIYTSIDSGVTWTEQTYVGEREWSAISSSSDGNSPAATHSGGYIYTYGTLVPSSVSTNDASFINKTYATLNGDITNIGSSNVTERGFQYGLTQSYGSTKVQTGTYGTGEFSAIASSLTCGTLYHFRAYSINVVETSYGEDTTFTTTGCSQPNPEVLYGVDGSIDSDDDVNSMLANLYILDKESGTKIYTIGPVGFDLLGLAYNPVTKILYGSTNENIVTINTETGAGSLVGNIQVSDGVGGFSSITIYDIAFSYDGTLYAWSKDIGGFLFTIDINSCVDSTCTATRVGASADDIESQSIVINSDDELYTFSYDSSSYYKISLTTGEIDEELSFSNSAELDYEISSAKFDETGVLYASQTNYGDPEADLITIDIETGEMTSLGQNSDMVYMSAIAFVEGAEISTPTTRRSVGSYLNAASCRDQRAKNYSTFGISTPSLCIYENQPIPVATACTLFEQNLKIGARDGRFNAYTRSIATEVLSLQSKLSVLGFYNGAQDGIFGKRTREAINLFQKSSLVKVDGIFGPITRSIINKQCL